MPIDWNHLKSFEAVARLGSLAAVSRKTGATQPTLSRHIRDLEDELGIQLFDRTGNGLVLSPEGMELFDHAQDMQKAAASITNTAEGQSENLAGTVRITASQMMARHLLPPILVSLQKEEPDIEIEVVASDRVENLLERDADIAVRMLRPNQLDIITKHLGDVKFGAYASREYLKVRGHPTGFADLGTHDFIGFDTHLAIINFFQSVGLKVNRNFFRFRTDDESVYWQMVLNGLGIGATWDKIGNSEPRVDRIHLATSSKLFPIWLTAHAGVKTIRRIRYVYDYLAEHISAEL